jgi:hypothetical protein
MPTSGPQDIKQEDLDEYADGPGGAIDDEIAKDATSHGGMDRLRERATAKAVGKQYPDDKDFAEYDGDGGYKYRVFDSGDVRIVKAPGGRGEGLMLTGHQGAHKAVIAELRRKGVVRSFEDDAIVQRAKARSADAVEREENPGKDVDSTVQQGQERTAEAIHKSKVDAGVSNIQSNPERPAQPTGGQAAQIAKTVKDGKDMVKMTMEEKSRDTAQSNAIGGSRQAAFEGDDPDAIMAAAKARAYDLLESGDATEAAALINEAVEKVKALKEKGNGSAKVAGTPPDDVQRAVESRRKSMGI